MEQSIDIKGAIENAVPDARVFVQGEACNASVVVISSSFAGKSLLEQQRMVNAAVSDMIASGAVHALSIKTYTPEQWEALPQKPF